MKALVVSGGTESIWVQSFIENVLLPLGFEVSVQRNPKETTNYEQYYIDAGVKFVAPYSLPPKLIMKIPKIRVIWERHNRLKALKRECAYNAVFVISANPFYLKCASCVCNENSKLFTWIIGSDILRANKNTLLSLGKWIDETHTSIACTSLKLKKRYMEIYNVDEDSCPKVIDYGNSQMPIIDELLVKGGENSKRDFLGIDEKLLTVAVGYNANPSQQHKKIINSLAALPDNIKKRLCIVIPMTYHKNPEYMKSVEEYVKNTGIRYKILTEYLNSEQMAHLWVSTDIFIHGQTTDALSSSVLEAVYAGCEVFNGKWLAYPEFENWGITLREYESFEKLTLLFVELIEKGVQRNKANPEIIRNHASWNVCRNKWKELIDGYCREKK